MDNMETIKNGAKQVAIVLMFGFTEQDSVLTLLKQINRNPKKNCEPVMNLETLIRGASHIYL